MYSLNQKILKKDYEQIALRRYPWEKFKNKTIMITGGSGFLAKYLINSIDYISKVFDYDIKVLVTTRDINRTKTLYSNKNIDSSLLTFIQWDLTRSIEIDREVNFVIHAASAASPRIFKLDPTSAVIPNTVGIINLFSSLGSGSLENFLYLSTSGVYGFIPDKERPNNESTFGSLDNTLPQSVYLESKRMGETITLVWGKKFSVPVTIVRPSICYGPGIDFDDGRSFADFIKALVMSEDIILESDGKVFRNFCYVTDVIAGIFLVLLKGIDGEAYNLATENEIRIRDLASKLVNEFFPEKNLKVVFSKKPSAVDRVQFTRTQVDCSKIKHLGWEETVSIADGFKRTIASY